MPALDFLAVGDVTTDTFIKLHTATITADERGENKMLSMPWGDKLSYEFATDVPAVGNAANAAIAAARLGLSTGFISATGADAEGNKSIAALRTERVDTSLVAQVASIPSNHDYVLWYGSERTILIKHQTFPHPMPSDLAPPRFVYLSSLGDETGVAHADLLRWLARYPETKLVFQPGRELAMPRERIAPLYAACYLCICNKEEAEHILGLPTDQEIKSLLRKFAALGPTLVLITDGLKGAYAFDGARMLRVPLYPDQQPPFERTGAGDAFASTVAAALALGKPLEEALLWGPVNSMSVVQKIGAQAGLLSRAELENLLAKAPADYALREL